MAVIISGGAEGGEKKLRTLSLVEVRIASEHAVRVV